MDGLPKEEITGKTEEGARLQGPGKEEFMLNLLKRAALISVGLMALTKEKIEDVVKDLVKKGEVSEKEGKELIADLLEKSKQARKEWGEKVEGMVAETLQRLKIPSRKEVDELKERIAKLEKAAEKKED
jgi:polyhydroxyalkanoate synthesis regulator phasin